MNCIKFSNRAKSIKRCLVTCSALLLVACNSSVPNEQGSESSTLSQNINQIMIADGRSGYKFVERNVSKRKAFQIVEHEGKVAAEFKLSVDMGGARDDWYRNGVGGYGQRFEYGERKETAQRFNKEIWTRMVFWLPTGTVSKEQTTLFDLKEIRNNQTFGPLLNLAIRDEGLGDGTELKIKHNFEQNDCIIGRDGDGENSFCDKTDTNVSLGSIKNYTGKWVEFVSRAVWSNNPDGIYDAWIDGKKIIGYRGNTSFGADRVAFKFGLYRIKLNTIQNPEDIKIYFTNVGTANTCEELEISNCGSLNKSLGVLGYPNARGVNRFKMTQKTDFIASGGRVLKYFGE